jgi:hypothetical protein
MSQSRPCYIVCRLADGLRLAEVGGICLDLLCENMQAGSRRKPTLPAPR